MNLAIPTPDVLETRFGQSLNCIEKTHDEVTNDYRIVLSEIHDDDTAVVLVQETATFQRTTIVLPHVPEDMAAPFYVGSEHNLDATIVSQT